MEVGRGALSLCWTSLMTFVFLSPPVFSSFLVSKEHSQNRFETWLLFIFIGKLLMPKDQEKFNASLLSFYVEQYGFSCHVTSSKLSLICWTVHNDLLISYQFKGSLQKNNL